MFGISQVAYLVSEVIFLASVVFLGYALIFKDGEYLKQYYNVAVVAILSVVFAPAVSSNIQFAWIYGMSLGLLYYRTLTEGWLMLLATLLVYWLRGVAGISTEQVNLALVVSILVFWLVFMVRRFVGYLEFEKKTIGFLDRLRERFN